MVRLIQKQSRAYRLKVQSIEERSVPSEPTEHWCGSAAKIETMRVRCDRGESVFHPLDAREIIGRNNDVVTAIKQRSNAMPKIDVKRQDQMEAALEYESDKFTEDELARIPP